MIFCTACGRPRNGPVQFCTACGAPFADAATRAALTAEQQATEQQSAAQQASAQQASEQRVSEQQVSAPPPAVANRADLVSGFWAAPTMGTPVHADVQAGVHGGVVTAPRPPRSAARHDPAVYFTAPRGHAAARGARLAGPREGRSAGLPQRFGPPAETLGPAHARAKRLPPAPPSSRRRKIAVAVLATLTALVAVAGVLVLLTDIQHSAPPGRPALARPGRAPARGHAGTSSARAPSRTRTRTRTRPRASAPAPAPAIRTGLIDVVPSVGQDPAAARVEAFLVGYFTAINNHSYRQLRPLLSPSMRQQEPPVRFAAGYETTSDSGAVLTAISGISPTAVAATVSFTSHQLPADSPSGTTCTDWNITLYLTLQDDRYVLDPPPAGYRAIYRAC